MFDILWSVIILCLASCVFLLFFSYYLKFNTNNIKRHLRVFFAHSKRNLHMLQTLQNNVTNACQHKREYVPLTVSTAGSPKK